MSMRTATVGPRRDIAQQTPVTCMFIAKRHVTYAMMMTMAEMKGAVSNSSDTGDGIFRL